MKIRIWGHAWFALVALVSLALPAASQIGEDPIYMKIEGIDGDVTVQAFEKNAKPDCLLSELLRRTRVTLAHWASARTCCPSVRRPSRPRSTHPQPSIPPIAFD